MKILNNCLPGPRNERKKMQEMSGIWSDSLAKSAQSPYIFLTGMSGIWAEKNASNELFVEYFFVYFSYHRKPCTKFSRKY